ncbi:hypothetical protein ACH5RR_000955 [Cinchona calisaya]|uniref:Ribosomal RNA-processing protein 42 n=1 Tax=Cinchona calisaya TaxID=153742 RepID=A0ABD3B376_9GENT
MWTAVPRWSQHLRVEVGKSCPQNSLWLFSTVSWVLKVVQAGAGIDLSSFSIVGEKICWDLYIEGLIVSSDGNLLDALGAAIKAALSNTALPKVQVASAISHEVIKNFYNLTPVESLPLLF